MADNGDPALGASGDVGVWIDSEVKDDSKEGEERSGTR